MNPTKIITYLIILLVSLLIGLITGNIPGESLNGFYSIILIGFWLIISIEFILKIKNIRYFNAEHNQVSLIIGSELVGVLYAIWGDFTPILTNSLLPRVSFNIWHLIFAVIYILYNFSLLIRAVQKYYLIYIKKRGINARIYTFFQIFLFMVLEILYMIIQGTRFSPSFWSLTPETTQLNFLILIHLIGQFGIFIGLILKKQRIVSRFAINDVEDQLGDIDREIENVDRFTQAVRDREDEARIERERRQQQARKEAKRRKAIQERRRRQKKQKEIEARRKKKLKEKRRKKQQRRRSKTRSKSRKSKQSKKSKASYKRFLLKMKPKTGMLTEDDFKCIFCFDLPSLKDGHNGIVLCPKCNYPAHVDEFKQWVKNSELCSRCDGVISESFRRHPKVIPIKTYLKAYNYWKKNFK